MSSNVHKADLGVWAPISSSKVINRRRRDDLGYSTKISIVKKRLYNLAFPHDIVINFVIAWHVDQDESKRRPSACHDTLVPTPPEAYSLAPLLFNMIPAFPGSSAWCQSRTVPCTLTIPSDLIRRGAAAVIQLGDDDLGTSAIASSGHRRALRARGRARCAGPGVGSRQRRHRDLCGGERGAGRSRAVRRKRRGLKHAGRRGTVLPEEPLIDQR